jgi:cytochrome c-type biogenesis protein CcmH
MLSVLLALMTAIAIGAVGWPLLRPRRLAPPGRRAHDLAVYRDQLAELERDAGRGVIDAQQAQAARLEIERRILAAGKAQDRPFMPRPKLRHVALGLGTLLPLLGFAFYLFTGRPDLPAQPFADRHRNNPTMQMVQRQIDALNQRVAQKPDDLQNWILLGRTQITVGHYPEAADAFSHAIALAPERADLLGAYAEALILQNEGNVTPAALQALDSALAKDPDDATATYYRGAADLQAGNPRAALERWLALEARSAPDAPYLPVLRRQIDLAAKDSGIDPLSIRPDRKPPPQPTPGTPRIAMPGGNAPSAADMDRMSKLSPQEREQAIRSMVDGLEAKLKAAPDDVEGWRRLGRARLVLDEPQKAVEAFRQADQRKPNDKAILGDLAEALLRSSPDIARPSAEAVAVLRRLLAIDADNPLALYFLADVEAGAGHKDAARDMLDRLLKQVPPDAPQRAAIEAKRKALE